MERFAHFVNLYFYRTAVSGGPNCLILLTISLGRRTIANRRDPWQGGARISFRRGQSNQSIGSQDSTRTCSRRHNPAPGSLR